MGKILLVYYSRTGYTAAIARELADWGGWDVEQIQDRHSRRGGWGFLRSILDVMLGRHSAILPTSKNPADYAVVVLGAPVWMGRLSAPIRTYIAQHRRHFGSLAFFCTYGGKGAEHAALRPRRSRSPTPKLTWGGIGTSWVNSSSRSSSWAAASESGTARAGDPGQYGLAISGAG
ncbi:MAG: flavodoxin family protein [Gammaproteobacteria bacterium]